MTDTVRISKGQTLSLLITFFEEDTAGARLDLTGATVTIREASQASILSFSVSVSDAAEGECLLTCTEAQSDTLVSGKSNWLRLEAQFSQTENIVTPKIRIAVQ